MKKMIRAAALLAAAAAVSLPAAAQFAKAEDAINYRQSAFAVLGHSINLGSPKQLQVVLFDELGMPKTRRICSSDRAPNPWLRPYPGRSTRCRRKCGVSRA